MKSPVTMGILGQTIVRMHERITVQWGRGQDRAVLAVLLADAGRRISISSLVHRAWPDDKLPQNPGPTLHTYANRIRTMLRASDSHATLENDRGAYQLVADPDSIDYHHVRSLIHAAQQAAHERDHDRVRILLEGAVELWRDTPLADVNTDWAEAWRHSVVFDEWIPANGLLIDAYLGLGQFDSALSRLNDLQREHGMLLSLAKRRLTLLARLNREVDASGFYHDARKRFLDDGDHAAAEDLRGFQDALRESLPSPGATAVHLSASTSHRPGPPERLRRLPRDREDFVGREDVLAELDRLTGAGDGPPRPMVTALVGPSGVGKTTAAVRWAHRTSARWSLGALFLNLHGFGPAPRVEASEVVDLFLDALGYPVDYIVGPAGREAKLHALLAERPMLVVLDNVLDIPHIEPLLGVLSDCVVLLTSQRRLGALSIHHGAPIVQLGPLPQADAAKLLTRRIGARTHHDPAAVTRLAQLSGGLPLAINIIADRAVSRAGLTLTTLVRQLSDPATLLHLGDDGDGTSLHSAFSLAYRELPPPQARVFRLLGVHPRPEISTEALAALAAADPPDTRRALDVLASAHLVDQPADIDRYRLHDLFHHFAAALVVDDHEFPLAQRRMLSYYLHTANAAHTAVFPHSQLPPSLPLEPGCTPRRFGDEPTALRWCMLERSNLMALIDHAASHGFPEYALRLPHAIVDMLAVYGCYDDISTSMTIAIDAARTMGDVEGEASSLNDLGEIYLAIGAEEDARHHLQQALDLARAHGMDIGEVSTTINLARLHHRSGRVPEAVRLYRYALDLAVAIRDGERQAIASHRMAAALADLDQYPEAITYYRQALDLRRDFGDVAGQVATHTGLATLYTRTENYEVAETHCRQAHGLLEKAHSLPAAMRLYTVMAELAHARNQDRDALRHAQHAIVLADRAHNATGRARALATFGRILADRGNREDARAAWQHASSLYRERGRGVKADKLDALIAELHYAEPRVPLARNGDEDTVALPSPPHPHRRSRATR